MDGGIRIVKDAVFLSVNPKVYSLETVYSAAYIFLDRAYIVLDGDPKKKVIVKLIPKTKENLKTMGLEFFNELVNYSDYQRRAEQTRKIRETLIQRALITNDPSTLQVSDEFDEEIECLDDEEFLEDPEGIAIPWEEKYGSKKRKK